ncbi:hypothetical protein Tco_1430529 [Tanacetum coccineum]
MMAIFHDMIEKTIEFFMDDFLVFRNSFGTCFSHLDKMLKRCKDTNICLNWEKSHFMVKEGCVIGHKISKNGIEVDKAKVDCMRTRSQSRNRQQQQVPPTFVEPFDLEEPIDNQAPPASRLVDYIADPWVPLILGRPFLRTARALIDVHNKRNECLDVGLLREYGQAVLGFSNTSKSGKPTLTSEPIVSTHSPNPHSLSHEDIEEFLNDDPSSPPLPPQELKVVEPKNKKSSIDEPPEVELKDLPPHLEYAFLEGTDKLPVIIAKDLKR